MEYVIDTSEKIELDWNAKGIGRIKQNVWNLLNTYRYEVAYNRTKGINPEIFDKPGPTAATQYIAEVYQLIPLYEPRTMVKDVQFTGLDEEGNMQFKVVIEI